MYSKFLRTSQQLMLLYALLMSMSTFAEQNDPAIQIKVESPQLSAYPEKCIALRQGKPCFTEVKFEWHAPVRGDYCIRAKTQEKLIRCWYNSTFGSLEHEFNSPNTVQYQLIELTSGFKSEYVELKVNWVYTNKRKKRRWRLF